MINNLKKSFIVLFIAVNSSLAQGPPDFSAECKQELKKLNSFVGNWKGEATYMRGPGSQVSINQEEKIEYKLDGTVLLIEGTGRDAGGNIAFNAMGLVNYNVNDKQFKFKTYLKDGRSTDAYFNITGDNTYEWGFDIPGGGKSKYTITIDPVQKTWNEKGEYSSDGNNWFPFLELNLKKVE
jgi:hypothetical protein